MADNREAVQTRDRSGQAGANLGMERGLALVTDLYELTMMYGYFRAGIQERWAVFDLFYRHAPWGNGFVVVAGLEQALMYLRDLRFTKADIAYLRSLKLFDDEFLEWLASLRFEGDVWAMPEGSIAFPHEPLLRVEGPIGQVQLIETMLLSLIGHQSLIATKASRVVRAAGGDTVLEFGLRRAQGPEAGILGARAAVIGGCEATSNVKTGQLFDVGVKGTHAHSWVMSFPTELEAFRAYARAFPDNCLLLVDTYDTLRQGIPHAIQVARELREQGHKFAGIRLDSGDLAYLSKEARHMLDEAGFEDALIVASSDLDENLIRDLKLQGARIDVWGVGTHLITGEGSPALGCVYKLAALEGADGDLVAKIKVSENREKSTDPGRKQVLRFYDSAHGKAVGDMMVLESEPIPSGEPVTLFDPVETWKRKRLTHYTVRQLLVPVMKRGMICNGLPTALSIQRFFKNELETFWPEYRRLTNPHIYHVDLSEQLWHLKNELIRETVSRSART